MHHDVNSIFWQHPRIRTACDTGKRAVSGNLFRKCSRYWRNRDCEVITYGISVTPG